MKNKISYSIRIILLISLLLFEGCLPMMRSAGGLSRGQFQVSYNAPFEGDVRYGVTDNIEYRYALVGESFASDLMYHTSGSIETSFALGMHWLPNWDAETTPFLPVGANSIQLAANLTVSKKIGRFTHPYIGLGIYSAVEEQLNSGGFLASGVEFRWMDKEKFPVGLTLTPEVVLFPGGVWGSLGIGFIFDTRKILGRE